VAKLIQIITIALALASGLGFLGVYGWEITKAWTQKCPPKPATPSQQIQTQDKAINAQTLATTTDSIQGQAEDIKDPYTYVATILIGLVSGVVAVLFGQKIDLSATGWKEILSGLYTIAYMLMGIASVVTWMFKTCESVLVKTLALSFLGLLVPVVSGFFKNNSLAEVMGWKKA
jgi:ABC-type microcin C transport system permease subunit YejE